MSLPQLLASLPVLHSPALCALHPEPDLWHGGVDAGWDHRQDPTATARAHEAAKAICRECPARLECLRAAMVLGEAASGVWGGFTPRERGEFAKLRRAGMPERAAVASVDGQNATEVVRDGEGASHARAARRGLGTGLLVERGTG